MAAAQSGPDDCVHLRDTFSQGEGLREILRTELLNVGLRVVDAGPDSECFELRVDRLADDVAVIEVAGEHTRVVELGPIEAHLRPRSLALTVAEELNTLRSDLPPLRPAVDPTRADPDAGDPEGTAAVSIASPPPAPSVSTPVGHHAVVAGARVDYAFDTEQTLVGGQAAIELDLGLGFAPRLRLGVLGAFGSQSVAPFGDFDFTMLGMAAGFFLGFPVSDTVAFALLPEFEASLVWAQGSPIAGATLNESTALDLLLRVQLSALTQFRLTDGIILELGPTVGWALLPVEVLGPDAVLGGISGPLLGGRLGIVLALP